LTKLTKVMFQVQIGQATTSSFNDITSIIRFVHTAHLMWTLNMLYGQVLSSLYHTFITCVYLRRCCFTVFSHAVMTFGITNKCIQVPSVL